MMRRLFALLLAALVWAVAPSAHAQDGAGHFQDGVQAMRGGNAAAATMDFQAALAAGAVDPVVYHGLGNALYRQGRLGLAVAAWRRGLVLQPGNGDIAANLDKARRQTRDRLDPPAPDLGPFFWQASMSTATSALAAGGLAAIGLLLLVILKVRGRGPLLWRAAVPLLVLAALLAASTLAAVVQPAGAVVVTAQVSARSALGPSGVDLFVLHEGAEVAVGEQAEAGGVAYRLVVLPDERKGWVVASALISTDPSQPFPVL